MQRTSHIVLANQVLKPEALNASEWPLQPDHETLPPSHPRVA